MIGTALSASLPAGLPLLFCVQRDFMKQGFLFLLPAACLACLAARLPMIPVRILAGWSSLALLWVAAGYSGLGPHIFGKRSNGTLSPIAMVAFAPYLVPALGVAAGCRWALREPACQQIAERLYFGRRLRAHERPLLNHHGIVALLDLTAATPEPKMIRRGLVYRSMPILDGTAPSLEGLRDAVQWIMDQSAGGPVYVHCAAGHGRAGLIAGAYLLASGEAVNANDAILKMQSVRPLVLLTAEQRRRLAEFAELDLDLRRQ